MSDNITNLNEVRMARASQRLRRILGPLSEEDRKLVLNEALRQLDADLSVEEPTGGKVE